MKMLIRSFLILFLLSTAAQAQSPNGAAAGTSGRTPAPVPGTDLPADYKLVPGDKLRIDVYKDAHLSQAVQVRPDGKITLPLAGDIAAAGRTPLELRDAIAGSLTKYINNPTVTVIVVEAEPPLFYVIGEVNHAGSFPLKGQVSVLQALAMAGGFGDFAKTKDITIRRGTQIVKFDYKAAVKGDGKPMFVQAGDTIIVP